MTRTRILAAGAFALTCAIATSAMAKSDKEFITDAIKGDNSEIALGQLAVQKGGSDAVKTFGKTLVDDHGKAKDDAMAVAKKLSVEAPDGITDEAQAESTKLQAMSGADFDREFKTYMISDHQKDIADFQDEAKSKGKAAKLAEKALPTLQKHLEIAQSLPAS